MTPLVLASALTDLPDWTLWVGLVALGLGLLGVLAMAVPKPREMSAEDAVQMYTSGRTGTGHAVEMPQTDQLASAKSAAAKLLKRNKSLEMRINARLEGAGSQLNASEWLLTHTGITLAAGFVGTIIGGGKVLIGLLFLVLGAVLPWMWLGIKRSRRRKAFGRSLPDTLQLMSGSLTAGLSLAQSIDTIVNEGAEPIASEFRRVLVETRLGVSLETALEGVAERFDSKDFAWVVMAINIQRRVGGNLSELLETVAAHHPRARVHASSGRRTGGRRQAVGVRARRTAAAVLHLHAAHALRVRLGTLQPAAGMADARRLRGHPRHRRVLDVPHHQGGGLAP